MRQDITFTSQGLRCSGWLYVPNDPPVEQKMPGIVMAHGYSGVKEMYLSNFAERFVGAGFITLVFDYRYCGGSEGEPRGHCSRTNRSRITAMPSPGSLTILKWIQSGLGFGVRRRAEDMFCIWQRMTSASKPWLPRCRVSSAQKPDGAEILSNMISSVLS